jgi:ABC-type transport system involved in multi-copper enzyme maturation permease subunit
MLGPIFGAEMMRAGRRGRAHVLRWIYAGWLCLQLAYVFDQTHQTVTYGVPPPAPAPRSKADAAFGVHFRDLVLGQQFILILLVTPAFVAGAVTDEKTRGTLQGLLTAYVTPADVVLGKLAARCTQVGILALTPLPLLALVGQYGGISPEFLVALAAVTALVLFGLGGVSMLASVWCRQTRSAVIATYAGLIAATYLLDAAVGAGWLPWQAKGYFDPLRPLDPALDRVDVAEAFRRVGQAALAWGGLGLVTTTLAVWQLRPAYLRQLESRPRTWRFAAGLVARPRPTRDVIAWKECHVGRRVPLWLGLPLTAGLGAAISFYLLQGFSPRWYDRVGLVLMRQGWVVWLLLTLIVGVRCSGSITGERERGTWDGLMTSPLSPGQIVRGKLRGILRGTWPYLFAYWLGAGLLASYMTSANAEVILAGTAIGAGIGTLLAVFVPHAVWWVALGLVLLAVGVEGLDRAIVVGFSILATWLAIYFFGAVGLWCSARSQSSWRSLLGTVVLGYAGMVVFGCLGVPIGCIGSLIVGAILEGFGRHGIMESVVSLTMTLGMAIVYWLVARSILAAAEATVAKRDRIPPDWVRMIEYDLPRFAPNRTRR